MSSHLTLSGDKRRGGVRSRAAGGREGRKERKGGKQIDRWFWDGGNEDVRGGDNRRVSRLGGRNRGEFGELDELGGRMWKEDGKRKGEVGLRRKCGHKKVIRNG